MNERNDFRYCLNTSTIRQCKLDVPREVEVASQAGYEGIELWVSRRSLERHPCGQSALTRCRVHPQAATL